MSGHPLIEAYHALYDVKDANLADDALRVLTYEALRKLEAVMQAVDVEVPDRYDGTGRSPNQSDVAHLVWIGRIRKWRIATPVGLLAPVGKPSHPYTFTTVESARAALEARGFVLGEVRGR